MNREIKFRDYDMDNKKLRYFDLDSYDRQEHDAWGNIMQYTGLKDWYEGDIIQWPNKDVIGVVKFGFYEYSNGADIYMNGNGFYVECAKHNFTAPLFNVGFDRCEVIGNIHETPELLTS